MRDYLLKREAELVAAYERLETMYYAAWQTGDRDMAAAHAAGQRLLLDRISEVQKAIRFPNGEQPK